MHFNLNKRVLASSFAAISVVATSLAATPSRDSDKGMICNERPKPGPFAYSFPQDIGLSCPRDFNIHIDGLAMQAKQEGLAFAISTSNSVSFDPGSLPNLLTPGAVLSSGKVEGFSDDRTNWEFNPGFRAGLGFFMDHDAWSVDLDWTWLNITNYRSLNAANENNGFIPLWVVGSTTPASIYGSSVNASWNARYNVLDLSVGKPYHISRYVVFSPHFGIRGGSIDQHLTVKYYGQQLFNNNTVFRGDNKFSGAGLRGGLKSDWTVGKGWNLFTNISGSMLSGKFEVNQAVNFKSGLGTTEESKGGYEVEDNFYQNIPNLEMAVGIAWSKYFDKNKYRVGLKASYEFIQWWDQLNMRKFFSAPFGGVPNNQIGFSSDTVSRGNLSLNGFCLSLQFDI